MLPNKAQSGGELAQTLLAPKSVAIVGASDDLSKTAARPLQFLRRSGYEGRVYPINQNREMVLGEKAWPSLASLPEVPDHAFIVTPTDHVIEAVGECGRLGVRVATILATGFSEGGAEGHRRVEQLQDISSATGLRILGPSSIGVVDLRSKFLLTANAAFAEPDLPVGGTFVASHSGSLLGALMSRGKARSVGFAGLVSVGNEVDLSLGEICSATLNDPTISGYVLFLESMRHAKDLRAFAIEAARRNKPVVAYKLGRSAQAAELALSHTGALAGEDDVAEAFLADCGIARVEHFETLLEALPLVGRVSPNAIRGRAPRVGIVTTTGGGAAMVVDELALRGIEVTKASDQTFANLAKAGVKTGHERIIDLTMEGTRYEVMKASLDTMLNAPEFDLVVAVIGSSARFQPDLAIKPVIDSAGAGKPLATFLVPDAPQAFARLAEVGVPGFRTPEGCADAISAAFRRRTPRVPPAGRGCITATGGRQLSEWDAYKLFEEIGLPHAPAARLPIDAEKIELPLPYPVVVKILHEAIAHKTEVGGVILNVGSEDAVRAAISRIVDSVRQKRPEISAQHVLIQSMTTGLGEVLLGYRKDPDVGPIVLLASGGVFTEIYRDRSIRLAPVDLQVAKEMISELAVSRIFTGYRGKKPGDLDALAQAIVSLSQLAVSDKWDVVDAEINPLIVRPAGAGVLALDAVVKLA